MNSEGWVLHLFTGGPVGEESTCGLQVVGFRVFRVSFVSGGGVSNDEKKHTSG